VKQLLLSTDLLLGLFMSGARPAYDVREGIPSDATLAGIELSSDGRFLTIGIRSAEFSEVPEGEPVPIITPLISVTYRPKDDN